MNTQPVTFYADSITHRIAALAHANPGRRFTIGQLLAATANPVTASPVVAEEATPMRVVGRSATQQIKSLLASSVLARSLGTDGRWFYTSGPVRLSDCIIRTASNHIRPGSRIGDKPGKPSKPAKKQDDFIL